VADKFIKIGCFYKNQERLETTFIQYTVNINFWRSPMSDLAATNCGCNEGGCNSIIWIILLLCCCCNGNGFGNGCGNGTSLFNGGDSCCWIIILLLLCGGCGNNNNGCC
jgi:hypothetical protein